jgi:hypothetical protein
MRSASRTWPGIVACTPLTEFGGTLLMRSVYVSMMVLLAGRAGVLAAQQPEPVLTIGVASGPEEQVFGHILDVAVGRDGDVFVLDDQALEVRWFDRHGELLGRTGRGGGLRSPRAIDLDESGELLVLDPLGGRIARYRASEAGLEHVGDIPAPPALDFCAMADRIHLLRLTSDSVITELDRDGRIVAGRGSLIEPEPGHDLPPDEIRRELDNRARLHCDLKTQTLTLLYERIPVVRRFTVRGEPEWRIELSDYHRVRDVHTPDESGWMAAPDPESGTAHSGRAIAARDDGALVVTLYEGSAEGGAFEVRVLSAATGEEQARGPVRMMIAGADADAVTGWVNSPVPRVLRYDSLPPLTPAPGR